MKSRTVATAWAWPRKTRSSANGPPSAKPGSAASDLWRKEVELNQGTFTVVPRADPARVCPCIAVGDDAAC